MCGIAGIFDPRHRLASDELFDLVSKMSSTLVHRGPDDHGIWLDPSCGIGLGHRRLAILDLSPTGRQPMVSSDGRLAISFNGEIYNFRELRSELGNACGGFRGSSDTEVLLCAIQHWGFESALRRLNGMFAIALWNSETHRLHLARDRMGEKPLYYGWFGGVLVFGSELKALRAYPHADWNIDRDALALYFRYSCVPAPYSIYKGVRKLPPACHLTWNGSASDESARPIPYWSLREVAERGIASPVRMQPSEMVEEVDHLLRDAIALRMQADVPVGAFLSGGIDSSTIVALMQAQRSSPVKTFTIGLLSSRADESAFALAIARHLGTDHTEHHVTPEEALAVVPLLPDMYDEPFSDSSQIPTHIVSAIARRSVTVTLSGDAGDELFAGYHRHFWRLWERASLFPRGVRRAFGKGVFEVLGESERARRIGSYSRRALRMNVRDKLLKLASVASAPDLDAMYRDFMSHWKKPTSLVSGSVDLPLMDGDPESRGTLKIPTQQIMLWDSMRYLPDDILVKVDRASMATSLEARIPFLDHRVVELAWRIPLEVNLRHPQGKWLLRQVLGRYVPPALFERPKLGFGIPLAAWLRGPLRDWAEALLSETSLRNDGFLDAHSIRLVWDDFLSAGGEWEHLMWDVLMFQAWHRKQAQPSQCDVSPRVPEVAPRRLRILHVFGAMDRGGAELRTLELMRNLDQRRFSFDFATLTSGPGALDAEIRSLGGEVFPCELNARFPASFLKLLRRGHYDVVHSHVYFSSGLILMLAAKMGVPTRIAHFRTAKDTEGAPRKRLQVRILRRWLDRHATHVLAVSEGAMESAFGAAWRSDSRRSVIYNGVDTSRFVSQSDDVRPELGLADGETFVIHVGSLNAAKNHFRLLEIFAAFRMRVPNAKLFMVGRDPENLAAQLQARIRDLSLSESAVILGERTDVPRLLSAANLMIFPSISEGLPGAVIEATAAGVPVLGSDIAGVTEIARHFPLVDYLALTDTNDAWAARAHAMLGESPSPGIVRTEAALAAFVSSPFSIGRAVQAYSALFEGVGGRATESGGLRAAGVATA